MRKQKCLYSELMGKRIEIRPLQNVVVMNDENHSKKQYFDNIDFFSKTSIRSEGNSWKNIENFFMLPHFELFNFHF